MNSRFRIRLAGMMVIAGLVFGLILIRQENQKIRCLMADEHSRQLHRSIELQARIEAAKIARTQVRQEELIKASHEVEELEKTAERWHAEKKAKAAKDAAALLHNQDPTKDLTRLDNFQNAGQATPSAGFQTFVWAVTKGENQTVSTLCVLEDSAEEFVQAIIAEMPQGERAEWTGEKLAGLFFQAKLSQYPAAQITGEERIDAQNVIVKLRAPGRPHEAFPMRLGSNGWQVVVSGQQIAALRTKVPALLGGDFVELP